MSSRVGVESKKKKSDLKNDCRVLTKHNSANTTCTLGVAIVPTNNAKVKLKNDWEDVFFLCSNTRGNRLATLEIAATERIGNLARRCLGFFLKGY